MSIGFHNIRWPLWDQAEMDSLRECMSAGEWSRGKAVERLEEEFADFCGCRFALLVSNGTEALTIALRCIGVGPGDEVIVPGLTWPSTAYAVMDCGATAVIADIEEDTLGLAPESVVASFTPKTKAVLPAHLYCSTADVLTLGAICRERGVALIEDAAQAHGYRLQGRQIGTFGRIGVFSFQQKKLMTCGEGGCLVTNEESLYWQAYSLRDHGAPPPAPSKARFSGNKRLSTLCAAVLSAQLRRLPSIVDIEAKAGARLAATIDAAPGIRCLLERKGTSTRTFYNFAFRLTDPSYVACLPRLQEKLRAETGVPFQFPYPPLDIHPLYQPGLERWSAGLVRYGDLKRCHRAYKSILRFPHQYLLAGSEAIDRLGESIARASGEMRAGAWSNNPLAALHEAWG